MWIVAFPMELAVFVVRHRKARMRAKLLSTKQGQLPSHPGEGQRQLLSLTLTFTTHTPNSRCQPRGKTTGQYANIAKLDIIRKGA